MSGFLDGEVANGEMESAAIAIRNSPFGTRTHSRDASASELFPAVARMSVNEIRDRRSRFKQPSRISLRSSGLQTTNKGEAERRKAPPSVSAHPDKSTQSAQPVRARKRPDVGGRSPSGAPTTALARATERSNSAQAALHARERTQALPAPSIALKRSTPRPGRSAGGDDARAARERGYKPRPQEPHSLHRSAVAGDVPSIERDSYW
jgi:hypothetical protein